MVARNETAESEAKNALDSVVFFSLSLFFPAVLRSFGLELTFLACWNEIKNRRKELRPWESTSRESEMAARTHATDASCFQTRNCEMRDTTLGERSMQLLIVSIARRNNWRTEHVSNVESCVLWSFSSHYFIVAKVWQEYTHIAHPTLVRIEITLL